MAYRSRAPRNQHGLTVESSRYERPRAELRDGEAAVRGQSRDAETRSNVHRRRIWQSHRLAARDDDKLLCRAVCTLPRRLPNPDALSDSAFRDAIADGVDRPSAVLVGDELRKRKLGTGPSPAARLPVGGIHARDMDLDPHLTMPRLAHRSLDEAKDLRPTGM